MLIPWLMRGGLVTCNPARALVFSCEGMQSRTAQDRYHCMKSPCLGIGAFPLKDKYFPLVKGALK